MTADEDRDGLKESLESVVLFVVPILVIIPFYVLGLVQDINLAYYIIYVIYILGSLLIVRVNRERVGESLSIACGFILAFIIVQVIRSDMYIRPDLEPLTVAEQIVYNFLLSGPAQEVLFRGVMFFALWRWKGWKVALVTSSVLFGLVHVLKGIYFVVATSLIGLVYGYVTYRTRNIVGPMIAHGLHNFILGFMLVT
nr:MAG: hypothetical protein AM324_10730 [Candidatus Thorarchaeota archaeon SMTZ1-83]